MEGGYKSWRWLQNDDDDGGKRAGAFFWIDEFRGFETGNRFKIVEELLMADIPDNHLGCKKTLQIMGEATCPSTGYIARFQGPINWQVVIEKEEDEGELKREVESLRKMLESHKGLQHTQEPPLSAEFLVELSHMSCLEFTFWMVQFPHIHTFFKWIFQDWIRKKAEKNGKDGESPIPVIRRISLALWRKSSWRLFLDSSTGSDPWWRDETDRFLTSTDVYWLVSHTVTYVYKMYLYQLLSYIYIVHVNVLVDVVAVDMIICHICHISLPRIPLSETN